jgi:hypothetical protein
LVILLVKLTTVVLHHRGRTDFSKAQTATVVGIVGILFDLRRKRHAEKDMRVKFTHDQHRAIIKLVLTVHLMPDIHAHAAPPDFALLERGRMVLGVQLFLLAVPAWEILLHRTCMAQNTGRVQYAVVG